MIFCKRSLSVADEAYNHYTCNAEVILFLILVIRFRDVCVCMRGLKSLKSTRQVTRATQLRNRVCPRVELILKIIIILLIIFLGFIKSKPC